MPWTPPELIEVKMDAEIGSYQDDRDPTRDPAFRGPRAAEIAESLCESPESD
jgi:hypothetical protein